MRLSGPTELPPIGEEYDEFLCNKFLTSGRVERITYRVAGHPVFDEETGKMLRSATVLIVGSAIVAQTIQEHNDQCWQWHLDCAVARVKLLQQMFTDLMDAVDSWQSQLEFMEAN